MSVARCLGSLWLGGASVAGLACELPALPEIPPEDGVRGRVEHRIQRDTLEYLSEMRQYVACIQAEHATASSNEAAPLALSLLAARNNAAVAELETIGDLYEGRVGPVETLAELADELADSDAANCIRGGPRPTIKVVDSQNILVYGRDGIFLNTLELRCPRLRRNVAFNFGGGYTFTAPSRFGQAFCGGQLIGVEGDTCKLGQYVPISEDEADRLLAGDVGGDGFVIEPVELPAEREAGGSD